MDERTCSSCGAQNAAGAHYCWQCYTRFGAPADAVQDRPAAYAGPLAAAIGRGPGAGTPSAVVTEPATMTRWQPVHGTSGDRVAGWVIKGLVAVLGELGDELRADEPGAADDDDLHGDPSSADG